MTLVAVVLPSVITRRRSASADERRSELEREANKRIARVRTEVDDILMLQAELIDQVVSACNEGELVAAKNRLLQSTVDQLATHLGRERTRACYFAMQEGKPRSLRCTVWSGRQKPTVRYIEGRGSGTHVFRKVIDMRKSEFNPNIDQKKFPDWDSSRGYRTYIATAVVSNDIPLGMLTVDAPNPGDLKKEDEVFVRLLAQILGSALAVAV